MVRWHDKGKKVAEKGVELKFYVRARSRVIHRALVTWELKPNKEPRR